ncbi:MAG: hypothetical protein WCF12_04235 [Propionicimonas sp.]
MTTENDARAWREAGYRIGGGTLRGLEGKLGGGTIRGLEGKLGYLKRMAECAR